MKVELQFNNVYVDFPCELCGNYYEPGPAIAVLCEDDGQSLGDVCPDCIEAGQDGINKKIKGHIKYHQGQIRWLESLLKRDIDLPTVEEFKTFQEECEKAVA